MPITPPGRLHIRHLLQFTGLATPFEMTYGCEFVGLDDPGDAFDAAVALDSEFVTAFQPGISDKITMTGTIYSGALSGGEEVSGLVENSAIGADADEVPPPNVACLIRKGTGFGGRRNRGRMYLPCYVDESTVDDRGLILTAAITALNTVLFDWNVAITTIVTTNVTDTKMVILHSTGAGTPTPQVFSLTAQPIVATQRRRLQRS